MSVDPTNLTALHSLDFGNVYSPDGREHPILGLTPVSFGSPLDPQPTEPATPSVVDTPFSNVSMSDIWDFFSGVGKDHHIIARLVVGFIAMVLVIVVAIRLIR